MQTLNKIISDLLAVIAINPKSEKKKKNHKATFELSYILQKKKNVLGLRNRSFIICKAYCDM
jgi:hypothetical protein